MNTIRSFAVPGVVELGPTGRRPGAIGTVIKDGGYPAKERIPP